MKETMDPSELAPPRGAAIKMTQTAADDTCYTSPPPVTTCQPLIKYLPSISKCGSGGGVGSTDSGWTTPAVWTENTSASKNTQWFPKYFCRE